MANEIANNQRLKKEDTGSETQDVEFDSVIQRELVSVKKGEMDDLGYKTDMTQINKQVSPTINTTNLFKTLEEYEEFIKLDKHEQQHYKQL